MDEFQVKFAEKVKEVLGEDMDEKIIKEGHSTLISNYLSPIREKIGTVKKEEEYGFVITNWSSSIKINDTWLSTDTNVVDNSIRIVNHLENGTEEIDKIIVKNGKLFSEKQEKEFDTEMFKSYLKEIFNGILS
ncbi:DUF3942 family protein [Bacillus toyonensis]|uniref:DUF3942 family protein n=1 Tax=Bacillus toyonensis TaxID=155322 RepID=UPI000BED9E2C|nr:DUF3942 family protein [Bacillus toyonensis]PEC65346.1 hypothetical protein CON62_22345 [Bacillus toyonensis]